MKPGMRIGHQESVQVTVTEEMFAEFGGEVVHPAYSTAWMVYHMEWASRNIILPYLEDEEEGMGASVSVKHVAPGRLGDELTVTAVVTSISEKAIVTEVKVNGPNGLIGIGDVKQAILPKLKIQSMLKT
ncbi:thioesterase [Neobacillus notoginsengisoli]|uniref:Thioesterase n=1 Tax=Neobacillus notoginsengisoli TaxID=1578198 RepID=A0A417YWY7_9BACI|nr:hotdog domain-containing protein [Neobacillus notoginsengisoli]RHW42103.1 thioesterase [Neobacillus notoginsengisoli]